MSQHSPVLPPPSLPIFERISLWIKAIWIFFPGITFILLGFYAFVKLGQGHDIIYQSTDPHNSWLTGIYLVLATVFWVFTSWYTARLQGYDRNDLYRKIPALLMQLPRLIAFSIFLMLWIAVFLIDDILGKKVPYAWLVAGIDFFLYWLVQRYIETRLLKKTITTPDQRKFWNRLRNVTRTSIIISCIIIVYCWGHQQIDVLLYTLPIIQFGFLFLLILRFPLYKANTIVKKGVAPLAVKNLQGKNRWMKYIRWTFSTAFEGFDFRFEKPVFIIYHILAGLALLCYLLGIYWLSFARGLTSFPLVMLSFGILLGLMNIVSVISHRYKVNITFLFLVLLIAGSMLFETHSIRTLKGNSKEIYARRDSFELYLQKWAHWHAGSILSDTNKRYPVFFVLSDGGASRSGYWAASVLSRLHETTRYDSTGQTGNYHSFFMDHLFCLSGASGGSVGNAGFLAAYAVQQKNPLLKTDQLSKTYLANDFLVYPLARMLGPDIVHPVFGFIGAWGDRATALEYGMEHPAKGSEDIAALIKGSFSALLPDSINQFPILSINTTRVNDGGPGVVSTINIDSSKDIFGTRIDVINLLDSTQDIRLSTAMILGARFPYMSPGGKVGSKSYFVDGGYFDNSGAGVIHEMLLEISKLQKPGSKISEETRRALKQMDFYVIHLSNTPPENPVHREKDKINPLINDLATPILTLAGSYGSQTTTNDSRLTNYLKELNEGHPSYIVYNLYYDSLYENISMNWVISKQALKKMNERTNKQSIRDLINRMNDHSNKADMFRNLVVNENKSRD